MDMALHIEEAFGVKMDTLMRMQPTCEIAQTRKREKTIRVSNDSLTKRGRNKTTFGSNKAALPPHPRDRG